VVVGAVVAGVVIANEAGSQQPSGLLIINVE
jgi:hypothetical protein